MSPAGDLRRPVARIGPRPGPDVTRGWATIGLAAASLACWAVQAVAVLGGALWLRRCTDECHGAVLGPLTVTVLLAPAGVGLLVAGLAAWDRAGRAVPASRAVDTVLEATSGYDGGPHSCTGDCSVRLRYRNAGYATAQIFEAEARGGANAVALGIKQTGTHDAGLGVHRGGHEVNLRSGRGVDSHLPPGDSHDRGLTFTPGVPVTLVLRGNFPEERVTLAVPASRA